MKKIVELICLSAVLSAQAFDSQAWLAKREKFIREAARMRAVYAKCHSRVDTPAENVKIPIEQFEDGSVKVLLEAKRMQYFIDTALVWGEGVKIRKFNEKKKVIAEIEARFCVVDREKKNGWAEGSVVARQDRTVMNGEGVYFSAPDDYLHVTDKVFVKSNDLSFGGVR